MSLEEREKRQAAGDKSSETENVEDVCKLSRYPALWLLSDSDLHVPD